MTEPTNNAPATTDARSAMLAAIAKRGLSEAQWRTLNNSMFPGAKAESILMAVDYCIARNLDVMKKPCHIVPMNVTNAKTGQKEWRDVIMPGIYELRVTADRTGKYAGMDEPAFGEDIDYLGVIAPKWCKVTVFKLLGNERVAFSHIERFSECVAVTKDYKTQEIRVNSMWTKRPYGQLAKCAEAGALRKAFPEELGGQHAADEFGHSDAIEGTVVRRQTTEQNAPTSTEQVEPEKGDDDKPRQPQPTTRKRGRKSSGGVAAAEQAIAQREPGSDDDGDDGNGDDESRTGNDDDRLGDDDLPV